MKEREGWWRVVINNNDCPFRLRRVGRVDDRGITKDYFACKLRGGQFNNECIYINCKKRY